MEEREDLKSILPLLPLILGSSSLFWPPKALESLKALALGPDLSRVDSGKILFDVILDLRESIGLSNDLLARKAADGYALFFDELISRMDSKMWFGEVIPTLANLMLRLPSLLEAHYRDSDENFEEGKSGLRIMHQQEPGLVFLSQELIASLLACAFFSLFPASTRVDKYLPTINFDYLFAFLLHPKAKRRQVQKVKCLVHYFKRISLCMPTGSVSFERKVLPFEPCSSDVSYPEANFWRNSTIALCPFEVFTSGLIEDQKHDALEVDFADEYLGGLTLDKGCVQEEIRFVINPELIVGMLFMASMKENEAIEIVGVERFSRYTGYNSSFRFVGDYLDKKPLDSVGRRTTKIIAIDAIRKASLRQFNVDCLVRDTNKAFCGYFDRAKYKCYLRNLQEVAFSKNQFYGNDNEALGIVHKNLPVSDDTSAQSENLFISAASIDHDTSTLGFNERPSLVICQDNTGIATGNWGCGVFGGDPEIKSIIQWLAASQALRPFIHYYTFGAPQLQRLEQVTQWILLHGWTVGDVWIMLVEYSSQKLNKQTDTGFLSWLLREQAISSGDVHYRKQGKDYSS